MTAWLVLDVSASMGFGTALRRKADVAEGVALASATSPRGAATGSACSPSATARRACVRPRQGRLGLLGLLAELRAAGRPATSGDGTGPRRADHAGRARPSTSPRWRRSRGLVVVVSDFRGPRDWEAPLRTLRARHGVLAVEIRDPRELELPPVGDLFMTDPETGRQIVVNTSRKRVRERFKAAAAAERDEVAGIIRAARRRPSRARARTATGCATSPAICAGPSRCAERRCGGRPGPCGDAPRTRCREVRRELPRAHRPARPPAAAAGGARLRRVPQPPQARGGRVRQPGADAEPRPAPARLAPPCPRPAAPAGRGRRWSIALARPQRTVAAPQRAADGDPRARRVRAPCGPTTSSPTA